MARFKVLSHRLRGLAFGEHVNSSKLEGRPVDVLVAAGHLVEVPDAPKTKPVSKVETKKGVGRG